MITTDFVSPACYYSLRRKQIKYLLEIFGCEPLTSLNNLKKSFFLAVIGASHFYIVNPEKCKIEDGKRKPIHFSYEAVIKNIYFSGQAKCKTIGFLEDLTSDTKRINSSNEIVGEFKLNDVYVAPYAIKETIKEEILKRKNQKLNRQILNR